MSDLNRLGYLEFGKRCVAVFGLIVAGCAAPAPEGETEATDDPTASAEQSASGETPSVVAVTALLCDIAEGVAGDAVDLTCLMPPGQDPHSYRLKPSDLAAIETAELVLYNGYNLTPGLADSVLDSAKDGEAAEILPQIVAVSEVAVPEPMTFGDAHGGHDDHGDEHEDHEGHDHDKEEGHEGHDHDKEEGHEGHEGHDHDEEDHEGHEGHDHDEEKEEGHDHDEEEEGHEGHDHAGHNHAADDPDPHVWHDASIGSELVSVVADRLSEIAPDSADDFAANADELRTQLASLDTWIAEQIASIPEESRQLVTSHDAFNYYTTAYGMTQASALSGLSPADEPTPTELAEIADRVKASGVPALFSESTSSPQLVESVAREAGIIVAESPLLVDSPDPEVKGAETYPAMLAYNTCTIVTALGGECDREALGF